MGQVLQQAAAHRGSSFVEVYQNCVIFNPTEWDGLDDRRTRDDNILYLEDGRPMIFGKNHDRGIRLNGFTPEIVMLGDGVSEADLVVHDANSTELGYILSSLEYPTPMGVFRQVEDRPTYTEGLMEQIATAQAKRGMGNLDALYRAADLWTVVPQDPTEPIEAHISGRVGGEMDDEYTDVLTGQGKAADDSTSYGRAGTNLDIDGLKDRLTEVNVAALGTHAPVEVDVHTSLAKAIRQMTGHKIGCVLVTDETDRLVGIFTERDVLMRVAGLVDDLAAANVGAYMTADPVAVHADLPIAHALHLMALHGFRHLPLVDDDRRPVGIISFRDVVHYLHNGA
jgi:CBS domain-containing protein